MQLKNSMKKQTFSNFNHTFPRTLNKLQVFLPVCLLVVVIEIFSFKLLPTNLKSNIPEYMTEAEISPFLVEMRPNLMNIVKSSDPKYPLPMTEAEISPFRVEMRPNLMNIVNSSDPKYPLPMEGPYRLENKTFCSSTSLITVFIIVLSSAKNFMNRHVIRQTWANASLFSNYGTVRTLFLLGRTNNATVETKVEDEFRLFGDIVQGNFVDSLRNLTHKSIMGYNWARKRCKNVKYVIKTDDDIVINMFEIMQYHVLETFLKNHHVLCYRWYKPFIQRDKENKFYMESHQFRGMMFYPPYCNGQFVAMVTDVIPSLYEAAIGTPYFWIDDIHMYGLSMNNIPALKYKQLRADEMGTYKNIEYLKRLELRKRRSQALYFVTKNSTQVVELWSALFNVYR